MESKRKVAVIFAVVIASGSAITVAAEEKSGQAPSTEGAQQMPMERGMMGQGMMDRGMMGEDDMGGMMGMMSMMRQCSRMMSGGMGGGMMGGMAMPQLLPGNEKLQLQMQAEIMQRVGEILAKYAGRVKDQPR